MSTAKSLAQCLEQLACRHKTARGEDTITSHAIAQAAVLVTLLHDENERLRSQAAQIAGVNTRLSLSGRSDPFDALVSEYEALQARLLAAEGERDTARAERDALRDRTIQLPKQIARAV